ncbi:MAG: hypothetical protein ACYCWE_02100 [Eubacteriales bacterium]
MMNKRFAAALLALTLLGFASCQATENESAVSSGETETISDTMIKDNLAADLDLGGAAVTFLYRDEVSAEFFAEKLDGELVNDTLYNNRVAVESRLNADIDVILMAGHYVESRDSYMTAVKNSVSAGDDVYDWVDLMIGNSSVMMQNGIFMDIAGNDYIDLDMPYYLSDMMDNVAINNRLYFISGDASLGYLKCLFCLYYNTTLAENYHIENLYESVDNGQWTIDKLIETAQIAATDLDGNGSYDQDDLLGFAFHDTNHPKGFITSSGTFMFEKDGEGVWRYIFGSERDAELCDALYRLKNETDGVYYCNTTDAVKGEGYDQLTAKFVSGEILLITSEMDDINSRFRAIEDSYGILPYPKFNEEQEYYYNCSRNTQNAFSMPITCSDTGAAGAVLEALSCANYNSLIPAYFETAMKTKYAMDSDSARMYDLIRDSALLTFWYTYNNAIGSPEAVFFSCSFSAKSAGQMSSVVASNEQKLVTALEKYLVKISDIESAR